jgi:hypothetical protein
VSNFALKTSGAFSVRYEGVERLEVWLSAGEATAESRQTAARQDSV